MVEGAAMRVTIEGRCAGSFQAIAFDPKTVQKIGGMLTTIGSDGTEKQWLVVEKNVRGNEVTLGVVGEEHEWFQMLKER
jgi:hypothetical protein